MRLLRIICIVMMMVVGVRNSYGQTYPDGIYYISHVDGGVNWYLWPSETMNSGHRYLTTFNGTSAPALNRNGVTYDAHNSFYSHWLVINRPEGEGGGFQLINVKLGTYIVRRDKKYGDRDLWLLENPTGADLTRSYFFLYKNDTSAPHRISDNKNNNYSFNSARGNKAFLTAADGSGNPTTKDDRPGLLQFYADSPKWFFESNLLEAPSISLDEATDKFTISYDGSDIAFTYKIIYTTNGADPTINADGSLPAGVSEYTSGEIDLLHGNTAKAAVALPDFGLVVTGVAKAKSQATIYVNSLSDLEAIGSGSSDMIILNTDLDATGFTTDLSDFSGTFDGQMHTISNLDRSLFGSLSGGVVKNVILDNVNISDATSTNVGAICNTATGDARIFNCGVLSGSVTGSATGNHTGSIAGQLEGSARVVNCYSFASVSGVAWAAGIVGYNTNASTISSVKTMVMNCMFYGEITSGTHISPIYGGTKITNVSNLNGYNYYRFDSDYSKNNAITDYNCALAAEEKYLVRFEFFRNVLNSNRELAAWYALDDPSKGRGVGADCEMAKWVLDTSIKPYPILKVQGTYPSVINYNDAPTSSNLSVTISLGTGAPSGASITSGSLSLPIYDKDLVHYHYNYHTVRLPYYNEVGTGNCTHNKVVTGWKITGFTGGTTGHFVNNTLDYSGTTHGDGVYPPYNFADRYCTDKDKYSVSGRVFSQGAYFDVPEGVTGITIEPYWGTAVYLSDPSYDVSYPNGYVQDNAVFVGVMGTRYISGNQASINGDAQIVYTDFASALSHVSSSGKVYDNAIVLVGNYHHYWGQTSPSNGSKAFTIMSADLNNDCEPDYSFIVQHGTNRQAISPMRFDFINSPGLGMIQKVETNKVVPRHGIWHPKGWFEVTNTSLIEFSQFEYEDGTNHVKAEKSPLILLGGIYDQFVTSKEGVANRTEYIIIGCNAWMKEFCNGTHTAGNKSTRHIPISVTGGEFEKFYLTGTFQPAAAVYADNAECYINGGQFGEMAGAGQEQVNGDVTWLIDHADITTFYGGGINAQKEVTGNIYVEINNSTVGTYCGGPKFGNMHDGKTVITKAQNSTFTDFFGAGYGGTSYYKDMTRDLTGKNAWDTWVASDYGRNYVSGKGIATNYEYEYIPYSGGQSGQALYVGRLYVNYASLSLAETKNVESYLDGCTITGSFYGGGKLGRVDGNATSTLKDCTVGENVFGAGFSGSVETVKVLPLNAYMSPQPYYNESVGVFTEGKVPEGVAYTWTQGNPATAAFDDTNHYIYTTVDLNSLGTVAGKVTLNIEGTTSVAGNVYGGGESSDATGDVEVNVKSGSMVDVFGGGKGETTVVSGDVVVNIGTASDDVPPVYGGAATISRNVYGGSAFGNTNATKGAGWSVGDLRLSVTAGKSTNVNLYGGAVTGNVFGGGLGQRQVGEVGDPGYVAPIASNVYGPVTVTTEGGTAQNVFGCNDLNGAPQSSVAVLINGTAAPTGGMPNPIMNVYGGGNLADYTGNPTVTMIGGTVDKIYGGGYGTSAIITGNTSVLLSGGTVNHDVYGGGDAANVTGTVTVSITGGTVTHDVYGGGALANTNTASTVVEGVTVYPNTTISLTGGSIDNVYGGGLGRKGEGAVAATSGNVLVTLNEGVLNTEKGCVVNQLFGCNNANGTPLGTVEVHVYKTQNAAAEHIANQPGDPDDATIPKKKGRFDVVAVYGGGNQAAYNPTYAATAKSVVVIEGCDETSIDHVYGGGNAAPVPATDVTINSSYEINYLFGGGNGAGVDNPGADVGIIDQEDYAADQSTGIYGTGVAKTTLIGGTINYVYGGSNTKGNVRGGTTMSTPGTNVDCPLAIKEIYGAGRDAEQDGGVTLILGCVTGMDYVYGGAKNANVKGGVDLVITSGSFKQVFGGNDTSGTIQGPITLTIEETGCDPIEIDELYLGGNLAAYSIYGYKDTDPDPEVETLVARTKAEYETLIAGMTDEEIAELGLPYDEPVLNVVSCTRVGRVFGGGLGSTAVMHGNPTVNLNMIYGDNAGVGNPLGQIGGSYMKEGEPMDGGIYGGGSEANVYGNTTINIGTAETVHLKSKELESDPSVLGAHIIGNIYGGGLSADVLGSTSVNIGTKTYTAEGYGVNITGNVFGGGQGSTTKVTGSVDVTIGNRIAGTPDTYEGNASITGDVYGGSALGSVNAYDNSGTLTYTTDATTSVTLNIGTITGSVYGGGLGQRNGVGGADSDIEADVYGPVAVTVYNGTVSNDVYGCNNLNGSPQRTVAVNINGTSTPVDPATYSITTVYGGGNQAAYNGTGGLAVNIVDGYVNDVFGGGLGTTAEVTGATTVTVSGGSVIHDVYGGGSQAEVAGATNVTLTNGTIGNDIYGGGKLADVQGAVTVLLNGGTVTRDVYGGGALAETNTEYDAGDGDKDDFITTVTLAGSTITGNLYGGGLGRLAGGGDPAVAANVYGPVTVTVSDGLAANVFGCNNINGAPQSTVSVNITGTASVGSGSAISSVYGGGNQAAYTGNPTVSVSGGTVNDVFGGGLGVTAGVTGNTSVTITSSSQVKNNVYGGGSEAVVTGNTSVTISGGTVDNDVFGGGLSADVTGNVGVSVTGGTVINDVYGGGALANTNTGNWDDEHSTWAVTGSTTETDYYIPVKHLTVGTSSVTGYYTVEDDPTSIITSPDAKAAANVTYYKKITLPAYIHDIATSGTTYKTTVSATGGLVGNIYGGGLGQLGVSPVAAMVYGDVAVTVDGVAFSNELVSYNYTAEEAAMYNAGLMGALNSVDPLTSDQADAYNDAMDASKSADDTLTDEEAAAYNAKLSGAVSTSDTKNVARTGRVFGCNNLNGTPKGQVVVWVKQTVREDGGPHADDNFEVLAVYGGGNAADYVPETKDIDTEFGQHTRVIIDGCTDVSIEKVYGGGNAADVPFTDVLIEGAFQIGYVFGGGNGGDRLYYNDSWHENEGANVSGYANVLLRGGTIGMVFGGSDTKGVVGGADSRQEAGECPLRIVNFYGAGNGELATSDGDITVTVSGCSDSSINKVFGGSYKANIKGSITLNIKSGIFTSVYGGNDRMGSVGGDITVNIEETDDCTTPIIIQNLFGGCYETPYPGANASTYDGVGDKNDLSSYTPFTRGRITVNIKSATRIDKVYGGSYKAGVNGDTEVNINMTKGNRAGQAVDLPEGYRGNPIPNIHGVPQYAAIATVAGETLVNGLYTYNALTSEYEVIDDEEATAESEVTYYEMSLQGTIDNAIGTVGDVYGGGYQGVVNGDATVNVGTETELVFQTTGTNLTPTRTEVISVEPPADIKYYEVRGAHITGNVFGGGKQAEVTGNTEVNICAKDNGTGVYEAVAEGPEKVSIGGSVFGGGSEGDVLKNTHVTMSAGYVFNGIFGGGLAGSVGTFTERDYSSTVYGHKSHAGCIGKPTVCKPGTGKCTVVINGGQIGPVDVAKYGMKRAGGPVEEGWVWGGGRGVIEDPSANPDTHFRTYVQETDVTISGTAFIMEGIIGGGEFGRVLGNTLVKIEGGQIGVGEGMYDGDTPIRYRDDQFINPLTTPVTNENALAECPHWDYEAPYDPFDVYYSKYPSTHFTPGSTTHPTDGKTWIGVVFGGGSGYFPYEKADGTGYDWNPSAGWVEGNTEVRISGGHILTNVYGANEYTDVGGKSKVTMTGGTIGVPRTLAQIAAHPLSCYLFGAGKGDERSNFDDYCKTGSVEVEVSGGIIYGSVFGGSEDGHVLGDIKVNISDDAIIGTWGTSYVDGNVFGGGRGYSGANVLAGNVGGNVTVNIEGGTMLGSVYGGGRIASVGLDLETSEMQDGDDHGHVTVNINGGSIGNSLEYIIPSTADNAAAGIAESNIDNWVESDWNKWKTYKNVPKTEYGTFSVDRLRLMHTIGGNVYAGGMGRKTRLDGTEFDVAHWTKLGNVKSTTLNVSDDAIIKSNVYGGGEIGTVTESHITDGQKWATEVSITGGTIGTEIIGAATKYTFGSVYGGGMGSSVFNATSTAILGGLIANGNTRVTMEDGTVKASVYGGGEMSAVSGVVDGDNLIGGNSEVTILGGTIGRLKHEGTQFGGYRMGNVYGGGKGDNSSPLAGLVKGSSKITIGTESSGPTIYHNIYGGGAYGSIGTYNFDHEAFEITGLEYANTGRTQIIINNGTIGIDGHDNGMVNGGARGNIDAPQSSMPPGEYSFDHVGWVYNSEVTINGGQIKGSVYGGGENGHNLNNAVLNIHGGSIGDPEDNYESRGNVYGAGCGTDKYYSSPLGVSDPYDGAGDKYNPMGGIVKGNVTINMDGGTVVRNVYGGGAMGSVDGKATVNISGGTVSGSVYGAPKGNITYTEYIAYAGSSEVNILPNATPAKSPTISGSVYGGGEAGAVKENVVVNMEGGMVMHDLYGGSALSNTNISNWDDAANSGAGGWAAGKSSASYTTKVNLKGGTIMGDAYGGALGRFAKAAVGSLGDPGYEPAETLIEPRVYGNILVELNRGVNTSTRGCVVSRIFGCNNLKGTPMGHVKVEVFGTQNALQPNIISKFTKYATFSNTNYSDIITSFGTISSELDITTPSADLAVVSSDASSEEEKKAAIANIKSAFRSKYDVQYVYGGGNLATYAPVNNNESTEVVINGCDESCIFTVYGGGNAASTPANSVLVNSVYEIEELFGGGNGKDDYQLSDGMWYENPGADVGYRDMTYYVKDDAHGTGADDDPYTANVYTSPDATTKAGRQANYRYGTGTASLTVLGGRIHTSYGGSNQKGNISTTAMSKYEESGECPLIVDNTYGASNFSVTDAEVIMIMDCVKNIDNIYGGSTNADVYSDIVLNITNGHFQNVYGGNNTDGAIYGSITVNIKELGCQPIYIGNLYGGGYLAPYSVYGYERNADGSYRRDVRGRLIPLTSGAEAHADPRINIISATRIDNVYGGGYQATVVGNPHINVNMERGMIIRSYVDENYTVGDHTDEHGVDYTVEDIVSAEGPTNGNAVLSIGSIGNIYGGGNQADIIGNTYVEIGTGEWVNGEGVQETIARNAATITESVYGGGDQADISGNTSVAMANGTVRNRIYGGGKLGNVGTISSRTTPIGHSHAGDCMQKPSAFADGTGTCTVVVSGGKIGMDNMSMTAVGGPDDYGYVFGAGQGELDDPQNDPDVDFKTYVNETYVTISDSAFVLGGVYGGSENGRVLNDTHVSIEGGQIGCGEGRTTPYDEEDFIDPTTATASEINAKATAMTECSSWTYGQAAAAADRYAPYDPNALPSGYYDAGGTNSSDGGRPVGDNGHTFYGNVFGGGSGFYPYLKKKASESDPDDYDWLPSAGLVEGSTHVTISGGHILTNVYGGNELTDVADTCYVTMTGGTLGVPRTISQIEAHPVTCYLYGGGKGDTRTHFNKNTDVGSVVMEVSGGIIYGSIFGGGEDGHVMGDVFMDIKPGAKIGTWGTSYVDGNVFGGGRGFSGVAYTAGNVAGGVTMNISGGTMLGSIYGGGRLGSVGYGLYSVGEPNYGEMLLDDKDDNGSDAAAKFPNGRGNVSINISGGTIGNKYEFIYPLAENIPLGLDADFKNWTSENWTTWKTANYVPNTEFDYSNGRLTHTKGGNVYAGGMGRREQLDGVTEITSIDWKKLGSVKSTSLTISGDPWIMGNVYGGGELGTVRTAIDDTDPLNPVPQGGTTTIDIQGGTIGSEITGTTVVKATVAVPEGANSAVKYTFGSVYGGGMGAQEHGLTEDHGGEVKSNTSVSVSGPSTLIRASVYGGGEMAIVDGDASVTVSGGEIGRNEVKHANDPDAGYVLFGGATMGNVYGGGMGHLGHTLAGLVKGNTNVTISGGNIYHMVYGGGALGSVGTFDLSDGMGTPTYIPLAGIPYNWTLGTGTATVTITGGTIGISGRDNGLVFGSSRGNMTRPVDEDPDPENELLVDPYDRLAWVNNSIVNIGTPGSSDLSTPHIKASVYGGGENGHNNESATVNVYSGTIGITDTDDPWYYFNDKTLEARARTYRGNVYGAGSGADTYSNTVGGKQFVYYNHKSGMVAGHTAVNISGGHVARSVYGAGAVASVGTILNEADTVSTDKHTNANTSFALSWPYKVDFAPTTGKTTVHITGGHIGTRQLDGGDVFGGARGVAGERYAVSHLAIVNETEVIIDYPSTYETSDDATIQNDFTIPCITGNVYGSGEDGCVHGDTHVTLNEGVIGHSLFGGGRGEFTYTGTLRALSDGHEYNTNVHNLTAGKVYGNTYVSINGGHVLHNVFGGGNMASVGKGNYAGGSDDYATTGYGETIEGSLWDGGNANSLAFLNSGNTYLTITGGTIGTTALYDNHPSGSVYGASRGLAAPNITEYEHVSPDYCPEFFFGYVNETHVFIGGEYRCVQACVDNNSVTHVVGEAMNARELSVLFAGNETVMDGSTPKTAYWEPVAGDGPTIYGSVYGGGQDGHVRRATHVIVNKGEIGLPYTDENRTALGTSGMSLTDELNSPHWSLRGNVFGAGSGQNQYEFDLNGDGDTDDDDESGYSTSAGSVTHFTQVDINGGTIHRNVYGGGSLASVGPPPVMAGTYDIRRKDDVSVSIGRRSACIVNIAGTVGSPSNYNPVYGGEVYGASRGDATLNSNIYSTTIWTQVNLKNGTNVMGNVFGGGDAGMVTRDAEVNVGE